MFAFDQSSFGYLFRKVFHEKNWPSHLRLDTDEGVAESVASLSNRREDS